MYVAESVFIFKCFCESMCVCNHMCVRDECGSVIISRGEINSQSVRRLPNALRRVNIIIDCLYLSFQPVQDNPCVLFTQRYVSPPFFLF